MMRQAWMLQHCVDQECKAGGPRATTRPAKPFAMALNCQHSNFFRASIKSNPMVARDVDSTF